MDKIKSSIDLVKEANREIKTFKAEEIKPLLDKGQTNLIDIRDIRELWKEGTFENSMHIPRGMLEFWLDPDSQYFKNGTIDISKELILFCAGGLRSALAANTLKEMGFKKVSHIDGGFSLMKNNGFTIIK